jgi:hypothetical protein
MLLSKRNFHNATQCLQFIFSSTSRSRICESVFALVLVSESF